MVQWKGGSQSEVHSCHSLKVGGEFLKEERWNFELRKNHIPNYVVEHVRNNMGLVCYENVMDKAWWTKNSNGKFSTKSAWELLRQRADIQDDLKALWCKGLPFKYSFLQRIWLIKVHVATLMHEWNPEFNPNCGCCTCPVRETIEHLFLKGDIAVKIWNHYCCGAGIIEPRLYFKQSVRLQERNSSVKTIFTIIPILILWFLWKRRNTILHGGSYSEKKLIWELNDTVVKFIKMVTWSSSFAFCIRNWEGNLVVAKGAKLQDTTSLVIEATAINEFLRFCRDEGIRQIIVESYSWIIVQVLNQEWEVSWSVSIIVNSIKELMRVITVNVVHSLREGNTLADFFTNLIIDFADNEFIKQHYDCQKYFMASARHKVKMWAVLAQIDLDDTLLGFDKMPSSWTNEDKWCKDQKALSQIRLHLSNQILQNVLKETIAIVLC
ncbi:hypothetical protein BC332_24304 [Capsicum chinense]|nr:hypothetical protein BC332_24304 [Capsicum chinense]